MFDNTLPTVESLGDTDDAAVTAAVADWTRVEAAAAARRLAAVAELVSRRADGPTDCGGWSCDNWDAMGAEVAAAQHISHGMASRQMYLASALRDRLPQINAVFLDGRISARLAATIVWHTDLIKDPKLLERVDAALAQEATRYGPLSVAKTAAAIDAIVDRYDPEAVRRTRGATRGREVVVAPADDRSGTADLWGSLFATDAAVLDRRLDQMAQQVCADDPRTLPQRRADALGALAAGAETLKCGCGGDACPDAAKTDARATSIVVHVVAEAETLTAPPDPAMSGATPPWPTGAPDPEPDPPGPLPPPAQVIAGGTAPASLLAQLIRDGARLASVHHPGDAEAETGYRPSAALERFIRCRDLTCRFPGCDRPAGGCDIDHTVAFDHADPAAGGLTVPGNLACLCRKHHLLKTFWTGTTGWRERQFPDGAIVWTAPTGHTYTTRPGSRLLYPALSVPTGELPDPPAAAIDGARTAMMPRRHRTREQDRAYRIDAERAEPLPAATPPAAASLDDDPPPF